MMGLTLESRAWCVQGNTIIKILPEYLFSPSFPITASSKLDPVKMVPSKNYIPGYTHTLPLSISVNHIVLFIWSYKLQ